MSGCTQQIWVRAFKNGPSKICGRQHLKNVKWYGLPGRLSSTNFTWSVLEYLTHTMASNATYCWWLYPCVTFKLLYWWSTNPVIGCGNSIFAQNLWSKIFPDMGFTFTQENNNWKALYFRLVPAKSKTNFSEVPKNVGPILYPRHILKSVLYQLF